RPAPAARRSADRSPRARDRCALESPARASPPVGRAPRRSPPRTRPARVDALARPRSPAQYNESIVYRRRERDRQPVATLGIERQAIDLDDRSERDPPVEVGEQLVTLGLRGLEAQLALETIAGDRQQK